MDNLKELQSLASNLTVLYVEDDTDIAKTIVSYLSKFFKEVLYAENGVEGLSLYKQQPCDLVITDIKMPKMHGLDMTFEIKSINSNQNIIIISAYSEVENFISSIKLGVDGYILKPVNYTDMNGLLFKIVKKINAFKNNEIYLNRVNSLIEELKLKNDELHHYTEALNKVAIVSKTDLKGYITFANDFFCDVCGYTKEELLGANHNIIRHPEVPKAVFKELWDTIQSGKTWEGDVKNRAKNGEPYYVHATVIPLFNHDGKTIREYIAIRFLTTEDELEKREFKKKVILNNQEFRKESYKYRQRIEELEEENLYLKSIDNQLQQNSTKHKSKHQQMLSQIKYYEDEIKKIHSHHEKVLEINSENNKKIGESYKKALQMIEKQKGTISKLTESNTIIQKEMNHLAEQVSEQRTFINDLRDTIKNLRETEHHEVKKGLLDKFL